MLPCNSARPNCMTHTVMIGSALATITAVALAIFFLSQSGSGAMTRVIASSSTCLGSLVIFSVACVKTYCTRRPIEHQDTLSSPPPADISTHSNGPPLPTDGPPSSFRSAAPPPADISTHSNGPPLPTDGPPSSFRSAAPPPVPANISSASTTSGQPATSLSNIPVVQEDDIFRTPPSSLRSSPVPEEQRPPSPPTLPQTISSVPPTAASPPMALVNQFGPEFEALSAEGRKQKIIDTIPDFFELLASETVARHFGMPSLDAVACKRIFALFAPMAESALAPERLVGLAQIRPSPSLSDLSTIALLEMPEAKNAQGTYLISSWRAVRASMVLAIKTFLPQHPTLGLVNAALLFVPNNILPKEAHPFTGNFIVQIRDPNSALSKFLTRYLNPYISELQAYYRDNVALHTLDQRENLMKGVYQIVFKHLQLLIQACRDLTNPLSS